MNVVVVQFGIYVTLDRIEDAMVNDVRKSRDRVAKLFLEPLGQRAVDMVFNSWCTIGRFEH